MRLPLGRNKEMSKPCSPPSRTCPSSGGKEHSLYHSKLCVKTLNQAVLPGCWERRSEQNGLHSTSHRGHVLVKNFLINRQN